MADTRTFVLQIASENNIDPSRVEGIIQKLLDEWYETAESLKEINEAQWTALGIPSRLVELIKKKLNTQEPIKIEENSGNGIELLVEEIVHNNSNELKACFDTLKLILGNILKSPEEKFRKIKKNNPNFHNKVGKFTHSRVLLNEIGFSEDSEFFILRSENPSMINEYLLKIEEVVQNLAVSDFNPYVSSVTSVNPDNPKIKNYENDPSQLDKEIQKVNDQQVPKIDREPKIINIQSENVRGYFRKIDSETVENEIDDEISQLAIIQNVMRQREELSNFKSKRKNVLNNKLKEATIVKVTVRVRFPDKNVLQGYFSVKENARDLYLFVEENLIQKGREFYLYEAPPKKIINNGNHILKPFAPATLLYFAWKDVQETTEAHGPFLKVI